MADELGVGPSDLRATSRNLNDVSVRMKNVLSNLQANLAAEGAAWGDDKMGDGYAKGSAGYLAQKDWVDGSVVIKTDLLDYYSNGLKVSADSFEQNDQP
ncbi:hypothetical protein A5746_21230 [Mycolicibacterium conceptionense]|uniref:hypothetical protein n=1 Tax=Mycolicibacterium conceptionense TaxID=451644 RepID=UPI0007ED21A5|nr:hypothetical protein [Mycolicibacterium conceptionense]OBK04575.1 hypothetical protein A5639_20015 [Mycolicibacterium conceptionense]OMB88305.1 hypothetical protein A5741_15095 [Mycolicibacterium conceptionense]OMB90224.1 hypothetical protein A5746_21230 [Mycolicibacterium conceptionense]